MTTRLRRRMGVLLVTLGALGALALPGAAMGSAPASNPQAAEFEKKFLTETIDHHFMGVQMGRLCMDKSRSRRLGDICTAIVVNQGEEIKRMRDDFLLDWYGVEKHPMLMPADRSDLRMLARRSGRRFDITLSRMFIEHHQVQLARSYECLTSAAHHKLQHTCMDQIETQSREIRQFRRVLRSYGLRR